MPISGLIIDGSSLEQALKATMANTITPTTTVLFLFTPQNYPGSNPPAAEFGKMRLRIQEIRNCRFARRPDDPGVWVEPRLGFM
jgi:hypothetical protein